MIIKYPQHYNKFVQECKESGLINKGEKKLRQMANIHIFDYEDGIQDFIGQMLPYDYKSFDWDKDGFFKFDELEPVTII